MFEILPVGYVPTAFEFGLFDECDVPISGDGVEPTLDDGAVGRWPLVWDVGARRRAVASKPLGLEVAGFDGACHDDFEGALAELDGRNLIDW